MTLPRGLMRLRPEESSRSETLPKSSKTPAFPAGTTFIALSKKMMMRMMPMVMPALRLRAEMSGRG